MKLDAARLSVARGGKWDGDSDVEMLVQDAEAAQRQAVKLAKSATIDAVQVLGGAGLSRIIPRRCGRVTRQQWSKQR